MSLLCIPSGQFWTLNHRLNRRRIDVEEELKNVRFTVRIFRRRIDVEKSTVPAEYIENTLYRPNISEQNGLQ